MMCIALIFDVFSIIPIVGGVAALICFTIIGTWLWFLGYGVINIKKLITPILSIIIEFIPALSLVPSIVLGVGITIAIIKGEEITGINVAKLAKGKIDTKTASDAGENVVTKSRRRLESESRENRNENPNVVTFKRGGPRNSPSQTQELREAA